MKNFASAALKHPRALRWAILPLATVCLPFLASSPVRAQSQEFAFSNDQSGGDWSTAATWNCSTSSNGANGVACVPANGGGNFFDVTAFGYSGGAVVIFNANPTTIDTLNVGGLATLQDDGNSRYLTIGDPASPYANSGTLANSGTINWGNGGILTVGTTLASNDNITNSGTINISDATLQVNGNFAANSGTLTIGNASYGDITGILTSSGTLNVTGDSELIAGAVNTAGNVNVDFGSYLKPTLFEISGGTTTIAGSLNTSTFAQTGGTVNVQAGGTVRALAWDIYGGTANVQGQVITETPSSGTITVGGNLNLQDGSAVSINGNLTVTGSVITGNGANDSGSNALSVSQLTLNSGSISLNTAGDSLTTGSLATSGTLVVGDGTSLVDTGSLVNSGRLTISGCPLGGCNSTTPQVTIDGTFTNSGNLDIPQTEDEVLKGGITLETAQNAFNSGNIGLGIIDALIVFGPTEVPEPDFTNMNGGTFNVTGSGTTVEVGNGTWNNEAGSSLTLSGGNDTVIANGAFANAGHVTLVSAGEQIVTPAFSNSGSVSIGAGDAVNVEALNLGTVGLKPAGSYSQTGGSTDIKGTLYSPAVNVSGGTVSGTGLIAAVPSSSGGTPNPTAVTVTGGTVMPGEPGVPGTLTVDGSYTQGADASLLIDIDGVAKGHVSVLDVIGAASLDGNVSFDFSSDFTPVAGESFTFLTADANDLTGMFSTDGFDGCKYCTLDYNDAAGTVTLDVGSSVSAPEPDTWLLLGAGLLGIGAALGKRRRGRISIA